MPPTDVKITNPTTTSLSVAWTDPNGNTTNYRLECSCSADGCKQYNQTVAASPATCSDLTPGTEYSVTVAAVVNGAEYPTTSPETEFTGENKTLFMLHLFLKKQCQ